MEVEDLEPSSGDPPAHSSNSESDGDHHSDATFSGEEDVDFCVEDAAELLDECVEAAVELADHATQASEA